MHYGEWNELETAMLVEAYIDITENKAEKIGRLLKLSEDLRRLVTNKGIEIDDGYRNLNGMQWQYGYIKNVFLNKDASRKSPKIFHRIVKLYKDDKETFYALLAKAHDASKKSEERDWNVINRENLNLTKESDKSMSLSLEEIEFFSFLKTCHGLTRVSKRYDTPTEYALSKIMIAREFNKYLKNNKINIFEVQSTEEVKKIERVLEDICNSINDEIRCEFVSIISLLKKYIATVNVASNDKYFDDKKEESENDYEVVLINSFPEGYVYENPLRKKRFINEYERLNNKKFTDNEEEYRRKLKEIGFENEKKIYHPSVVNVKVQNQIKNKIDELIVKEPYVVYYEVLHKLFYEQLEGWIDSGILRELIKFVYGGKYGYTDEYLYSLNKSVNLKNTLIHLFEEKRMPLSIEDIYSMLPTISKDAIDDEIHDSDFVVNFKGKSYFYINIFEISQSQLEEIKKYIRETIDTNFQVSGDELFDYISSNMSELIEANCNVTKLGFKNALKYKLSNYFNFNGDVISNLGEKIDVKSLYSEFCKEREKFTKEELEDYKNNVIHKNYIDYDAVIKQSIRVNKNDFINLNQIDFDKERIDSAISLYNKYDYILFTDIINYIDFPSIGYPWNEYVLESYLYSQDGDYKLLHASFNGEYPVGVIVKKNSKYKNLDDVIIDLVKKNGEINKESVTDYLLDNKVLYTRKYKQLDVLIEKARKEMM